MARAIWIANALSETGIPVVEVPGWETRGSSTFAPRGGVIHHDGYRSNVRTGDALNLMVHGRPASPGSPALPGPLCHVWLDDDNDTTAAPGDPVAYVIAAGRANHAGKGGWNGLSGNSTVWGIEARNSGGANDPWSPAMLDAYHRVAASLAHFAGHGPEMVCGHKEWAPGRKPDPAGINMSEFRQDVKWLLGSAGSPVLPSSEMQTDQATNLMLWFTSRYDIDGGAGTWPTLKSGATGDWVRVAQGTMSALSGAPSIDGVYGPATRSAVGNIQRLAQSGNPAIVVDGVVGPQTWQVLRFFVFIESERIRLAA